MSRSTNRNVSNVTWDREERSTMSRDAEIKVQQCHVEHIVIGKTERLKSRVGQRERLNKVT